MGTLKFVDFLTAQLDTTGSQNKTKYTNKKIQLATFNLLQEHSYNNLNVKLICLETGLSRQSFYLHYKNKEAVILKLLKIIIKTEMELLPTLTNCKTVFLGLKKICDWYLNFNFGLGEFYSTTSDIKRSVPEIKLIMEKRSVELLEALAYQLLYFEECRQVDREWLTFTLAAVGRAMNVSSWHTSAEKKSVVGSYTYNIEELSHNFAKTMYQSMFAMPLE